MAGCDASLLNPLWVSSDCHIILVKRITHPEKPPCGSTPGGSWVERSIEGRFYRSNIEDGNVIFTRGDHGLPLPGPTWSFHAPIFTTGDAVAARFVWQIGLRRLWMVLERDESGTRNLYWTYSDDEGATWATPEFIVSAFSGSSWATLNGDVGRCWFEFNSGTSGPGKAKGQLHASTDMTGGTYHFAAIYTFKDDLGADIVVAENGMSNVILQPGTPNILMWSPTLDGDSTPSTFYSADLGKTWTKT